MSLRVYAHLEKTVLARMKDEEYTFRVRTADVNSYRDEFVAGIVFRDYVPTQKNDVLLNIYTYHLREGFKNIELVFSVDERSKGVILEFRVKDQPGDIPNFDDNAGDSLMGNVLDAVSEFDRQKYQRQGMNLFRFVEKVQWKGEEEVVRREQAKLVEGKSWIPFAVAGGIAVVCLIAFLKLRK